MKLICSKSNLLKGVNIVSKAVPTRTTMAILECILIDDLKKNINEWEAYGGTGILFTNSEEVLQEVYRKIEMME